MTTSKLLHAADLHLDSPLRGLARYEGAPAARIREATRRAFENLVGLCLEERVDAVLLAGDLYDGDWPDYSTGLFFSRQMSRLREADVRVFMVRGNHDAQSQITASLRLPDNVVELSTKAPETIVDERLGLAVHGQGFRTRAVTEDLAAGYPARLSGLFNVGLLHTSLDGRPGHDPYAPTSVATLVDRGYEYWALGHVHAREVVHMDPYVVYPGNLQGRHARETGEKGATLLSVEGGKVADVAHRSFDVVRWVRLEVDATEARVLDDVLDGARAQLERAVEEADGRLVAARIEVTGESACHAALAADPERCRQELRNLANDLPDAVWVEKVRFETRSPLDLARLRAREDAVGQLARRMVELREDDAAVRELARELVDLDRKLPRQAKEGVDGFRYDDLELLREVVGEVEASLLSRLLGGEGAK